MECAIHIRNVNELGGIDVSKYSRIYVGDDSCPNMLPSAEELEEYIAFADANRLALTLLTSFCYDTNLKKFRELIPSLQNCPKKLGLEVAINDWGCFMLAKGAGIKLALGRVLTKQKKGPRISRAIAALTKRQTRVFSEVPSEFYERFLIKNGFARIELDNPVQGVNYQGKLPASLHYPFVLAAPSASCLLHGMIRNNACCMRECSKDRLVLKNEQFDVNLVYKGNSQYYKNKNLPKESNIDRIVFWPRL